MANPNSTTAPAEMNVGDNYKAKLDVMAKHVAALGKAEASGLGARADFGVYMCQQSWAGEVSTDQAEYFYGIYATSLGKAMTQKKLVGDGKAADKSHTAQVSKLRAFIKLGALSQTIDGPMLLDRAKDKLKELYNGGTKVESDYVALTKVCTDQCAQPETLLTEDQLIAALSKKESAPKEDVDKLIAAYKSLRKLASDIPCVGTIDAADAMAAAIVEMGGEVPATTKKEKEEAAFMARFNAEMAKRATSQGSNFSFRTDGVDDAIIIQPLRLSAN